MIIFILCKKIVQGTVPGKIKRGRQNKSWKDNIEESTGLDFNSSQRAAEDRQRWQKSVADVSRSAPTTLLVPGAQVTGQCMVGRQLLDLVDGGLQCLFHHHIPLKTRSRT